jgi:hypothetical protein
MTKQRLAICLAIVTTLAVVYVIVLFIVDVVDGLGPATAGDPASVTTEDTQSSSAPVALPASFGGNVTVSVGRDIEPGTYATNGPVPGSEVACSWSVWPPMGQANPSGAPRASDRARGPARVTVTAGEVVLSLDCQPWHKVA